MQGKDIYMHILIVEDNRDIADNIADFLELKGHSFDFAMDGIAAVNQAINNEYDVIVLDIMLPSMNGFEVCKRIRDEKTHHVPIIMLTARDTLDDKLDGFDSGADDYLVKPFDLPELEARIKVLGQRFAPEIEKIISVDDLSINTQTREVKRGGQKIKLNNTCYKLLSILMLASPRVVSRAELELKMWGDYLPGSDVLRTTVYTLRGKIDKPFNHDLLHTVHGVGFLISKDEESAN